MKTVLDLISSYQQSAPVNVEGLIKELGVSLEKDKELNRQVLGQLAPTDVGYKITVNKNDHYFRQRFTMAHELGHFLMHRELIHGGIDDDTMYRSTNAGTYFNPAITPAHEVQANQFAAYLLMPTELVRREWEACTGDVKAMANKFQVSPAAMQIRVDGLGLTRKAQAA